MRQCHYTVRQTDCRHLNFVKFFSSYVLFIEQHLGNALSLWSSGDLFHLLNRVWLSPLIARDSLPDFTVPVQRCMEIQRASLATKRSTFGELSAEVADTLQLIGSVEMTEGRMKLAHRTMTKVITSSNRQTAQLMFVLAATCKFILEMPGRVEVTVIKHCQKYVGGFNKRPGVSGCVHQHRWDSCSKYTHKESLSCWDELFSPSSLKLSAIRVAG